ncbi:hypothetical protein NBH19_01250 [Rhizobium sp. S95]|uniref:EF-hand domain-containing protein n=1 Tax=Ciceribacter sichuanensis TaxID=2949647 RepID=A0AAJ1BZP9_9HYPH|nr:MULTISPECIES: hypothetical protein [unclassified Ciceribacter]MCM2394703.1 hypothetical protein [Ciceribacter sp. S95]MCO5958590.1 hypothetical protein [Ciceribacter sp. S101]
MSQSFVVSIAALAIASTCYGHALAESSPGGPASLLFVGTPKYLEAYLFQLMQPFRIAAGEDQILTQEDIDEADRTAQAQQRSQVMNMFFAADLNGDLNVTVAEWQKARAAAPGNGLRDLFEKWDANNDDVVTVEDVYSFAKTSSRPSSLQRKLDLSTFMALEAAQDGKLTASELEQAGRATFRQYDVDNDGMLAPSELKRFSEDQRKHQQGQVRQVGAAACGLPKARTDEKVLFVSGYEAAALSTVTVAGQDKETNTAELNIEPGKDPLFIIATSYTPMIWRVTGAAERVSRFVTGAGSAGVVGLGKDRVTFADLYRCLPGWIKPEQASAGILDAINMLTGSSAPGVFSSYTLSKVTLPSEARPPAMLQKHAVPPSVQFSWGPLRPTENGAVASLKRFSPGGIVSVDAGSVVSSAGAAPYEVLPQEAGLAQLMQDGKLEFDPKLGYIIRRAIPRFPAGLAGAHAVVFVLADGVPRPVGRPGHSAVLTLEQAKSKLVRRGGVQLSPGVPEERIKRLHP